MSKVGDLSWARPGGAALKAHGFTGIMRYFSHDDGKNLSHDELVDYLNNGLDVGVVWESTATRALGGAAAGAADGRDALAMADAIGYTGKIYSAVDFDINDAQKPVAKQYQDAFNDATGGRSRAAYGGFYLVKYLKENGSIDLMWQTLAWSGGQIYDGVQLYQNGANDFGGGVDVNDVRVADFGQMGHGSTPEPSNPTPAPSPVATGEYTVVAGDTLSGIAARFGTTYQALAAINGIADPNKINVGQVIKLTGGSPAPAPVANGQTYTVVRGDTLSGIGAKYGISYQAIADANGISDPNKIYPGQVLRIPGTNVPAPAPAAGIVYVVQSGDTLSGIASKYGTIYQHLAEINGIADPNKIYPGQSIRIN